MARPSPATTTLVILWVGYALVMSFMLYAALDRVNLKLFLILGSALALFVIVALAVARKSRPTRSANKHT